MIHSARIGASYRWNGDRPSAIRSASETRTSRPTYGQYRPRLGQGPTREAGVTWQGTFHSSFGERIVRETLRTSANRRQEDVPAFGRGWWRRALSHQRRQVVTAGASISSKVLGGTEIALAMRNSVRETCVAAMRDRSNLDRATPTWELASVDKISLATRSESSVELPRKSDGRHRSISGGKDRRLVTEGDRVARSPRNRLDCVASAVPRGRRLAAHHLQPPSTGVGSQTHRGDLSLPDVALSSPKKRLGSCGWKKVGCGNATGCVLRSGGLRVGHLCGHRVIGHSSVLGV
jgi:hypothetical protein